MFSADAVARRVGRQGHAPVREELTRRLEERLSEVQGLGPRVLRVEREDFEVEEGGYDAVVVDMVLPVVEDVPLFLYRCVQALRPDGLLLASTLGVGSFGEFAAAWGEGGHVVPLTDVKECGALLQKLKLALPVVDRDMLTLTFGSMDAMYDSLRAHGVGNVFMGRMQGLCGKGRFKGMEARYAEMFRRPDGRVPLTVEVVYLHGFKPAAGQPLAARRGSGKVSLVRIMGGDEAGVEK